jgi:hypothetical protein
LEFLRAALVVPFRGWHFPSAVVCCRFRLI